MIGHLVGSYLAALLVSLALVPVCRRLALRYGRVATPKADRWHTRQTALLGGIAVTLTVFGLMPAFGQLRPTWVLLASAALIFALGLADDVRSLRPATKLVGEIGVASLLVFFDYRLEWVESLTLDTLLTLFWIVGITNAFNLLDNMDGLCGGVTLVAGVSLLAAAGGEALSRPEATYLVLLLGACTGFLVYNVHPASIFLGDSGSLFLGLSLAALSLNAGGVTASEPNVLAVVAVPAFVLLIPIFDTTLVTASRLLSGRRPSTGGTDHASHRLVAIGLSERAAVAVLWALAAAGGCVGVFSRYASPAWSGPLAALFLLAMAIFAVYLANVRVYEDADRTALTTGKITPVVVTFISKRRPAEVALDACLVSVAYYAAYRLRFEGREWGPNFPLFLQSLPLVVGVQVVALFLTGAYRGVWRYFSLMDGVVFGKSVLLGTTAVVILLVFGYRFESYSRAVFVIHAALLMLLLTGSRASFRLMSEFVRRRRADGERLVVYGADDTGAMALRELTADPGSRFRMLGFIDDEAGSRGSRLHGYEVLGGHETLVELVQHGEIDTVVLGTGPADPGRLRELAQLCAARGVSLSRVRLEVRTVVTN